MNSPTQPEPKPEPEQTAAAWQPRFSLRLMLLVMLILSVMAAAGRYLVMSFQPGQSRVYFVLFTVAAPVLVLVAVSVLVALFRRMA